MKKNYFKFSDFCIGNDPVPVDVADKIYAYHLFPLQQVREAIGVPIIISRKSCYRSVAHELAHGRDGSSEHTFKGKGACDLVCGEMDRLLVGLTSISQYTRFCFYPNAGFLHADCKSINGRMYYLDFSDGNGWQRQNGINDIAKVIREKQKERL